MNKEKKASGHLPQWRVSPGQIPFFGQIPPLIISKPCSFTYRGYMSRGKMARGVCPGGLCKPGFTYRGYISRRYIAWGVCPGGLCKPCSFTYRGYMSRVCVNQALPIGGT